MRWAVMVALVAGLAGCSTRPNDVPDQEVAGEIRAGVTTDVLVRPRARPAGLANRVANALGAGRVEDLDQVSEAEKAAATAPVAAGASLGTTVASLGNPAEPGLWLKTPLVSSETAGRVSDPTSGKSVAVTLLPLDGPSTAGSRMSLSAMRTLGLALDGLPTVEVFL